MSRPLPNPGLCLITDETRAPADNVRTVQAALRAGCRWVQLRHRGLGARAMLDLARRLRILTAEHSAILTINDRIDVAMAAGADGVHLPAAGMEPRSARLALGPDALLGASVHSIDEAVALASAPLDYLQFGPVFETASKRAFGPPLGLERLTKAVRASRPRPVCAVGGLDAERGLRAMRSGAAAIAVIGAVHGAVDPAAATRTLLAALRRM